MQQRQFFELLQSLESLTPEQVSILRSALPIYDDANSDYSSSVLLDAIVENFQKSPYWYARHGHELMGLKSPVGKPASDLEPPLIHKKCPPMITTSLRQVQSREGLCGGSLSAKVRADEQKSHIRPSLVGE